MERRMFETGVATARAERALTLPASMVLHGLVVAVAITLPLIGTSDLPEVMASPARIFFVEPQSPPAAPPPPPPADEGVQSPTPRDTQPPARPGDIIAPPVIPDDIPEPDDGGLFGDANGLPGGVPGGVAGGIPGGIVGGLLPGLGTETRVTPRPVGGNIRQPRKLRDVAPVYPDLPRQIGLQGDVVLECVIDVRGRVAEATVVSGSPLLAPAALDAARHWIYTPTLLNGVPVPILLRATVRFRLARS